MMTLFIYSQLHIQQYSSCSSVWSLHYKAQSLFL